MLASFTKNWWTFLLRGIAAIIFGALALVSPGSVLLALVYLFGAFAILDGVCVAIAGLTLSSYAKQGWLLLLQGVIGILIGIATFFNPTITWQVLLYFIAAWALVTGTLELITGIRMRKVIEDEWSMIFGGILSVLLGLVLAIFPGAGSISLVWSLGVIVIIDGVRNIIFSIRLKGMHQDFETLGV